MARAAAGLDAARRRLRGRSGVLGDGADLLVDCLCYTADDATSLVPLARSCTSTVMISSKAVYVDAAGRHVNSPDRPRFDAPIRETDPTMAPGGGDHRSAEGYGSNKVAAEQVLLDSGEPVTVIRASKVHGPGSRRPREWMFVRRVLDRRPVVLLAGRGQGIDHPTATANLAALIEVVAAVPGRRVLNSADPDAPSGLQIARTIAAHLGHYWQEVLLGDDAPAGLGRHPWDGRLPIVLDTGAAEALGYRPVGSYAQTVVESVDPLVAAGSAGPADLDVEFFAPLFDYPAEDHYLASRTRCAGGGGDVSGDGGRRRQRGRAA